MQVTALLWPPMTTSWVTGRWYSSTSSSLSPPPPPSSPAVARSTQAPVNLAGRESRSTVLHDGSLCCAQVLPQVCEGGGRPLTGTGRGCQRTATSCIAAAHRHHHLQLAVVAPPSRPQRHHQQEAWGGQPDRHQRLRGCCWGPLWQQLLQRLWLLLWLEPCPLQPAACLHRSVLLVA